MLPASTAIPVAVLGSGNELEVRGDCHEGPLLTKQLEFCEGDWDFDELAVTRSEEHAASYLRDSRRIRESRGTWWSMDNVEMRGRGSGGGGGGE